jgi:DNA-binding transcriptional MerR regulator
MYTLTEIARKTGISMATLQRYKKRYQRRLPSEGKGRKQRYPDEALPVFLALKAENAGRRGRPRKRRAAAGTDGPARRSQAAPRRRRGRAAGRKPAAGSRRERAAGDGLLTLTEVGERTGISYTTLTRYARLHGKRLPHVGSGRARRYRPEAVEAFRQLRAESKPGRRPGGGKRPGGEAAVGSSLAQRELAAERAQEAL